MRCEFARQMMDGIEDGVSKASAAETWCKVVMPGILEATRITGSLVRLMVARRERAILTNESRFTYQQDLFRHKKKK
jgi:hypothetical protein